MSIKARLHLNGNLALQEYYHRQADQVREHAIVLSSKQPLNQEYADSLKRQLGSGDGSAMISLLVIMN